jgi:hypothetical protein
VLLEQFLLRLVLELLLVLHLVQQVVPLALRPVLKQYPELLLDRQVLLR